MATRRQNLGPFMRPCREPEALRPGPEKEGGVRVDGEDDEPAILGHAVPKLNVPNRGFPFLKNFCQYYFLATQTSGLGPDSDVTCCRLGSAWTLLQTLQLLKSKNPLNNWAQRYAQNHSIRSKVRQATI